MARQQQKSAKRAAREEARRAQLRKQRLQKIGIGLGAAVLIVGVAFLFRPGPGLTGTVSRTAWDLPTLQGEGRVALSEFSGKPTVAAFFASWCPHCQRELPGFAVLADQLGDEVNFVGINTQDNGNGLNLARRSGIDAWPLARDIGGSDGRSLSVAFGARGMPLTVIYAPDGSVADVNLGVIDAERLFSKLQSLFGVGT
jgi:thiol-disulfide isomerase/thioredoxin